MKKNGYVRRFLALFLTLMMIMADSSVTTFAATVGMVKQQNGDEQQAAVQANSSQHNVQINADEEFDLDKFVSEYPYIMLGSPITNWPNVKAESTIESVNVTGNTVLNDVTDNTEKKIYFVKGKEEWNLGSHKCEGDIIEQGEDQFRISISENSENLIVNIKKLVPYNIEIEADKKFSLSDFVKKYKYAMLGKKTSSGIEAISTIGKIDVGTTSVIVKVEDGIDVTDNTSVYFVKGENSESWGDALTNGSTVKQVNNSEQQFQTGFKIVVSVDESANDNWKVKFEKAQYEPGNSVDYENVLGNALHYGIVANDITVGGHMEANLAAGTLHGSSNMNTSKNRGGSGVSLIGAYEDSGWKIEPNSGSTGDLIIYTTEEALAKFHDSMRKNPSGVVIDTTTYTKEEIQEIVRNMVNDTIRTSIALNKNAIQASVPYTEALNGNRVDLDLTNSPAGTYYINFKVGDYERYNYNFKINGNQNIVLNIPDTTVYAKPYTLMIDGVKHNTTDSTSDIEAGLKYESSEKVIYNFPNATDVTLGQLEGTILAPKAYVHNDGVGGGCIVGNSVKISGSEWHCVSKNIPTVTSYALKAKKTVNGKAPVGNETGKFTFKLYKLDDKGNATLADTKTNGDGGLISFDAFGNITEVGTYWYKITEEGDVAGYTRDTTEYYAEVKVTAVSNNGVIISKNANVTYHEDSKDGATVTIPTFNNTKKENETSASINVRKTFTNGSADKAFSFKLIPVGNAPMPEGTENGMKSINASQNDGIKSFGNIKYTEAGIYTYEVTEDSSNAETGITYDNSIWKVTVNVPEGFETPTVTYSNGKDTPNTVTAEFINSKYEAAGSLSLAGSKKLDGKTLEAGEFNFEVTGTGLTSAVKASNTAEGEVNFGQIASWNGVEDKTFTFEVGEVNDGKKGYTYDGTKYTVKVKATFDNATKSYSYALEEGTSKDVTIDAATGAISLPENSFTNTYTATGSTTLTATKKMTGRSFQSGDNWTFTVTASPTTAPMPEHPVVTTSATSGNSETLDFGKINYTLDNVGTYVYTIIESGNVTNVENDPIAVRTVTVTVTDNGDGTLNVQKTEDENGLTFTNKYAEGETTLGVTKVLSGREFKEGDAWTFNLTADSETAPMPAETSVTTTATSGNRQSLTFGTIKYSLADVGNTYTYTITESGSGEGVTNDPNATRTVTVTVAEGSDGKLAITRTESEGGTVFTNIYNAAGSLTLEANKKLKNKTLEAGAFSFELKELTAENTKVLETIPNEADGSVNFTTINYTLADVGTHTYTVSEVKGSDGTVTYDGTVYTVEVTVTDAGNGTLNVSKVIKKNGEKVDSIDFTNTYIGEIEIAGTKTWNDNGDQDGIRPTSITVNLLANGEKVKDQKVTPDGNGNWNYKFEKLSEYNENGKITYTVTEDAVEGYTTELDGNNFINTHVPETTEISGTKTWDDADDQDGKRPENITVKLLANGEEVNSQTVTPDEDGSWAYSFTDLPKFVNGQEITYTVSETPVEDYSTTYDGYNIINSYTPGQTSATITKLWADADNQDGIRPDSITVTLLADGKETGTTATLTAANNWTETITGLPEKANGKTIEYTWAEKDIPDGYELTDNSTDGTVTTLTNTHTTEVTSISGTKTWNDAEDQDGKRPESITVRLLANGIEKDSQTVKADEAGSWTYKFTDLPKYEAGEEIVYTVTEDAVPDYTTEISGYDITNSYAPGKTSVTVTKAWVDNNNCDNHRPDAIKVQLKADGVNSGEEITLNAENNWTYTWSDLDQKKAGKDIAYTVEETGKAAGYISTVTGNAEEGFIITNTITSVKISKVDITDQKELAGAHIQVIDKDGNVVEEWDSTWEAHEVTGLKPGETYTLRETVAPEGYTLTSDTTFTLKEDGTVNKDTTTTTISDNGTLLVEDSRTSVKVSKVDISDGKELEGAHIQIIDQDGNVVDEWDSTKEAHVTEKLKTGKIYTLRETVAPDGYLLTSDTTFVLKEDGTVDAEKTTAVSKDGVLLVQDKLATSASIAVTKKLTYIGESLAARDQTFYVALYSDQECTQRVSDVKALVFKNADASTVVFSENIKAGKTYYIAECTQDGISQTIGALADGTVYEAVFGNGNSTTVTEVNGTTTVSFENVFSSFPPDGFYKQGQLTITKKVLGADGGTRNSNEVFYAGIFDDAAHTQLSQQVEQNIIKLDMDGGYEVSETINVGLAQSGAKVTLYVTETDSNGKPIAGSEGFGYKVTVSADSVIFDETNMTAEVVITNQEESTVTETPTPTPSSDGGNSGGSENHSGGYGGSKSPKTGDDTPIGTYLMLLLAAAMLAAETERRRRRNKRQ